VSAIRAAVWAEFLKARRSRIPWAITAGFSLAPLIGGLFMLILKDPEGARRLGLLGTKAQLTAGTADWPTYLSLLAQAVAIGGGVLFAFLTAWIFGREFSDRTIRGLLAIPTPRSATVSAKALVIVVWGSLTAAWVLALGFVIGALVDIPGWSTQLALDAAVRIAAAAILTLGLQSVTAFVAGVGNGFLAPLGWTFLMVFFAQVLAALGWGAVFPWAVPAIVAGAAGPEGETAGLAGLVLVAVVAGAGFLATIRWWDRADHTC
jgi:ABC-2 type transport system permease protein